MHLVVGGSLGIEQILQKLKDEIGVFLSFWDTAYEIVGKFLKACISQITINSKLITVKQDMAGICLFIFDILPARQI